MENWTSTLLLPNSPVPVAAIFSPNIASNPTPPTVTPPIPTCPTCSAVSSVFDESAQRCQFCHASLTTTTANATAAVPRTAPLSPSPVVDYYQTAPPSPPSTTLPSSAVIFIIDGTLTHTELNILNRILAKEIQNEANINRATLIGIVGCGAAVSIFELGGGQKAATAASADVYPGHGHLDDEQKRNMVHHEEGYEDNVLGNGTARTHTYLAPSFVCTQNIHSVLASMPGVVNATQSRRRKRLNRSRLRRQKNTNRQNTPAPQEEEDEEDPVAPCPSKRCLVKATETALMLMKVHHCNSGHIVICTSGSETERSRHAAVALGEQAVASNVRIDVFTLTQSKDWRGGRISLF